LVIKSHKLKPFCKVIGINWLKYFLGEYGMVKYQPKVSWTILTKISQIFVRNYPEKAYQLLCIKELS